MPPDRRRKIETATTKNSDQHKSDRDTARRLNIHAKSQKIFVLQLKVCMPDLLRLKPKTEKKAKTMLVRNKEGKFFEIDEEQLKGKEVEGPKPPKGPSGPPPGGGGAAPLIVVNVGGRPGPGPGPQGGPPGKEDDDAEGRWWWYHWWHYYYW
jgi:hypothetical protein